MTDFADARPGRVSGGQAAKHRASPALVINRPELLLVTSRFRLCDDNPPEEMPKRGA